MLPLNTQMTNRAGASLASPLMFDVVWASIERLSVQ